MIHVALTPKMPPLFSFPEQGTGTSGYSLCRLTELFITFPRTIYSPNVGPREAWSMKVLKTAGGTLGALKFFVR